jgi:hypothetical protein
MGVLYCTPLYKGSALQMDKLGPCRCTLSYFLVPGAGQPAFLDAADHIFAFIMSPFTAGHLVGNLDAIAIWVTDVDTNSMTVV